MFAPFLVSAAVPIASDFMGQLFGDFFPDFDIGGIDLSKVVTGAATGAVLNAIGGGDVGMGAVGGALSQGLSAGLSSAGMDSEIMRAAANAIGGAIMSDDALMGALGGGVGSLMADEWLADDTETDLIAKPKATTGLSTSTGGGAGDAMATGGTTPAMASASGVDNMELLEARRAEDTGGLFSKGRLGSALAFGASAMLQQQQLEDAQENRLEAIARQGEELRRRDEAKADLERRETLANIGAFRNPGGLMISRR